MVSRRFERDDAGVRRFWEIELEGREIVTRRGRLAGLVDAKRRKLDSPEGALEQAELQVEERTNEGWIEVTAQVQGPARNAELERAIVDDPRDPAPWSVYADWLQARGDPFGEPLALSLTNAAEFDPRALWSTQLRWLGNALELERLGPLEHRHGFLVEARVEWPEILGMNAARRLLAALLRSPTSQLLRRLTLARPSNNQLVDALLGDDDSLRLEQLRELTLGEFEDRCPFAWVRIGDLARVLLACPTLERLRAWGSEIGWTQTVQHGALERLELVTGGLASEVVEALLRSKLPRLRRLDLWFGQPGWGASATIEQLRPLFDPTHLPELRELGLINAEFTDAIVEALVGSRRLATLERLDLSRGTLHEPGAAAILTHAAAFRRLRSLDLDANYLSPASSEALALALPGVVRIGEQVDPTIGRPDGPPGYYAAVGE